MKKISYLMVFLMCSVVVSGWSTPPPITVEFRGTVFVDSIAASNGTIVSIHDSKGTVMDSLILNVGGGYYNHLGIIWDDPDTTADEGVTYDDITLESITFQVDGQTIATPASFTLNTGNAGSIIYQDLNA